MCIHCSLTITCFRGWLERFETFERPSKEKLPSVLRRPSMHPGLPGKVLHSVIIIETSRHTSDSTHLKDADRSLRRRGQYFGRPRSGWHSVVRRKNSQGESELTRLITLEFHIRHRRCVALFSRAAADTCRRVSPQNSARHLIAITNALAKEVSATLKKKKDPTAAETTRRHFRARRRSFKRTCWHRPVIVQRDRAETHLKTYDLLKITNVYSSAVRAQLDETRWSPIIATTYSTRRAVIARHVLSGTYHGRRRRIFWPSRETVHSPYSPRQDFSRLAVR